VRGVKIEAVADALGHSDHRITLRHYRRVGAGPSGPAGLDFGCRMGAGEQAAVGEKGITNERVSDGADQAFCTSREDFV
jgi:hypothetical protein